MTDYEIEYRRHRAACGEPFPEFVDFFAERADRGLSVLDLGCGQGRDALMAASFGHTVYGVDLAPTGVAQMLEAARAGDLPVTGHAADLRTYTPNGEYDVVLLDRVVHMLLSPEEKQSLIFRACDATCPGGHILIADTPSNLPLIEAVFAGEEWSCILRKDGFRFFQREGLE